jgi:hypothetical protein
VHQTQDVIVQALDPRLDGRTCRGQQRYVPACRLGAHLTRQRDIQRIRRECGEHVVEELGRGNVVDDVDGTDPRQGREVPQLVQDAP